MCPFSYRSSSSSHGKLLLGGFTSVAYSMDLHRHLIQGTLLQTLFIYAAAKLVMENTDSSCITLEYKWVFPLMKWHFPYVSPYQCKGGDILLSASVSISSSALKNLDSTHKLGNTIKEGGTKLMTASQGPTGISQTSGQSAALFCPIQKWHLPFCHFASYPRKKKTL